MFAAWRQAEDLILGTHPFTQTEKGLSMNPRYPRYAITLAACLLAASPAAQATILAGPITNTVNQHLYYLLSSSSWTDSETEAIELGGHLATINDLAENQWIMDTFMPLTGVSHAALWIGLNDTLSEGRFVWASGEPVAFSYWYSGEPNNLFNEDYAAIRHPTEAPPIGSWNDLTDKSAGVYGVVEVDPIPKLTIEVASVAVQWRSLASQVYQLQYRSVLTSNTWINLGAPIPGTGSNLMVLDPILHEPRRFYRVRLH